MTVTNKLDKKVLMFDFYFHAKCWKMKSDTERHTLVNFDAFTKLHVWQRKNWHGGEYTGK